MLDFWKQKKPSASASAIRLLNSESFFERLIRYLSTACMTTIISKNSEEPMTEVTGFRQSVRLFWSRDPVAPSILSSFLLHLSDALPSGRVLLRLSVRVLTLTVLLRCRLFKWAFTTASTLPRGTVASLSGYFRFRSACLYVTGFTRCWVNSCF